MSDQTYTLHGVRVLECAADGPFLEGERDATDVIGNALSLHASMVVIPVVRLSAKFFALKTRIAGEMIQKFVNYGIRLVILGDVSSHVAASDALRDYIRETNRGTQVWFLSDRAELEARLG